MFYDGNLKMERGAVVLRLAPSWFRFGSFEILALQGENETLRQLFDFVIENNFPHIKEANPDSEDVSDRALSLLAEVTESTAKMIARWMSVGFAHGVMNTDNMSIVSVTIDYGPFGFVDAYDPHFIPNSSDDGGRYDLQNQPSVGLWNLAKLARALFPLISGKREKDHHPEKICMRSRVQLFLLFQSRSVSR